MATTEHRSPIDPPSRGAMLRQITDLLTQTEPSGPTAVGITFDGGEVEFAIKPLEGRDAVRALAGFTAPPAWHAFALVSPATAHSLDGEPSRSVFLSVLAARDGTTASALTDPGRPLADSASDSTADSDGEGRVLDACRRVMGLPTAPPGPSPALWAAMHWIDAILAAAVGADLGTVPSWLELLLLDPGVTRSTLTWAGVRSRCASGALRIPSLDSAMAAWMDDGMFSRDALTAYPNLHSMLADLKALLSRSTYESVLRRVCDGLEQPGVHRRGA